MRVIGGKYKGRKLATPKNDKIRPTSDRVKESIFNIIADKIASSIVIDAYSGSGALGIEALSRGASKVYFIDKDFKAIELIKKNLEGIEGERKIIKATTATAFSALAGDGVKADLIFLDPPYYAGVYANTIRDIAKSNLLASGGLVIVEQSAQKCNNYSFEGLRLTRQKKYGDTVICFYSYVQAVAVTGTFDPITCGHISLIEYALRLSPKVYIALLKNENKKEFFGTDFRLELIKKAVSCYGGRVRADKYDGLAIDYCKENNVQLIVRGIRNEQDRQYEQAMADWNREHGGIETLFVPAQDSFISSSAVRQRLAEGLPLQGFVPAEIANLLIEKMHSLRGTKENGNV